MFNSNPLSSIREYSNNFYSYAAEKSPQIWNSLDGIARKVAIEIHSFMGSLDKKLEFSDDSTGETLKRVWSMMYTPPSSEESEVQKIDKTTQVIKKLAFSLLIAIPVAFAIKDTLQVAQLDLADASSVSHAVTILAKKILYIGAIMYVANIFLSVTEMFEPNKEKESPEEML